MQEFEKYRIELMKPLMIIKGSKGFLGCGYVNIDVCDKVGECCAIVTGVNTFEDMEKAEIVAVSRAAEQLGICRGMDGRSALELLK